MRRVCAILGIWLVLAPAEGALAQSSPLSPPPSVFLACVDDQSVLIIEWQVGEYGSWRLRNDTYGDVSGPGGVFTAPTTETHVVPHGWVAEASTFRLNRESDPSGSNQTHIFPVGATCPAGASFAVTWNCDAATLTVALVSGAFDYVIAWEPITQTILAFEQYGPRPEPPTTLMTLAVDPALEQVQVMAGTWTSVDIHVETFDRRCPIADQPPGPAPDPGPPSVLTHAPEPPSASPPATVSRAQRPAFTG